VLVEIEDTAPGIPRDIRDRVFEPFVPAGKANGLGLGLALSRQTVLNHHGKIWTEPASGAHFVHPPSAESRSIFTKRLHACRVFYFPRCVQAVETIAAQKHAARQIEWLASRLPNVAPVEGMTSFEHTKWSAGLVILAFFSRYWKSASCLRSNRFSAASSARLWKSAAQELKQ
jgi:hypothetical protein